MKKNNFILAVTMMFVVVATIIIGQTQVVFAHSENTRVIEFKAEETIEKIERETIQARERGFEIDSVIVTMTLEYLLEKSNSQSISPDDKSSTHITDWGSLPGSNQSLHDILLSYGHYWWHTSESTPTDGLDRFVVEIKIYVL